MGTTFTSLIAAEQKVEGQARSAADAERNVAELRDMMQVLESKRMQFIHRLELRRGQSGDSSTEVGGNGRSIMRVSNIAAKNFSGAPDDNLKEAIADFFRTAQGGTKAKSCAVEGAKAMMGSGLSALLNVSAGQGMEKEMFVVLFMNNAFVRVDFMVYCYCATGSGGWGALESKSGACYVADLAVINTANLEASEIDFLLSQALTVAPGAGADPRATLARETGDLELIMNMKIMLAESAVLSRMLGQRDLDFARIRAVAEELSVVQRRVKAAYSDLQNYDEKPATATAAATTATTGARPAVADPPR